MPGVRGAAAAALGLVVLEALVTPNATGTANGGIGKAFDTFARGIESWFDPGKPAIPDLKGKAAQQTAATTGQAAVVFTATTPVPFNTAPQAPSAALVR